MSVRLDKLGNLIKEEVSLIFLYKLRDPQFGFLTVTSVKVSSDLKYAKVYLSIFDKDTRDSTLEKVNDIKGFIRTELAKKVRMKYIPELSFYIDDTLDYVEKMDDLFKKINDDSQDVKE